MKYLNWKLIDILLQFQESVETELRQVVDKADELKTKLKTEGENVSGKVETLLSKILEHSTNAAKELSKTITEKKN